MKTMLLSLILAVSSAVAASTSVLHTYAMDAAGNEYPALYTESAWMSVECPLSEMGGTIPSDLKLTASGLPEGTTITLVSVKQRNDMALLKVKVKRTDIAKKSTVNALASITLMSGSQVMATMAIPVIGAAYDH